MDRVAIAIVLSIIVSAASADTSTSKVVDGVAVYIGVSPAEMIRGHPKAHPEGAMHEGVPKSSDEYHVIIALFDSKTGQRITDVTVKARVEGLGMAGAQKLLEPMTIADAVTYGNYFKMVGTGPFRITVSIQKPSASSAMQVQFEHKHQ